MEASSEPARRRRVNWPLGWGLKVGKITYRLVTALPNLKFWSGPATSPTEPRHKVVLSMDSGICISFEDDEEASESQAPLAAAVVVTPPPAVSTPPIAIPVMPPPLPDPSVDPLFSMGLTLRSRQHIDDAIANGAFAFPYPNLAQDQEEVESFSRHLQQTRTQILIDKDPTSTSPRVLFAPAAHPPLLTPWPTFDADLTARRSHIARLATTLTSLTSEAAHLDALLDDNTHSTRLDLQHSAQQQQQHVNPPPRTFPRDARHFRAAQKRRYQLHAEIAQTRAQWTAAVDALEQLKRAQHAAD